MSLADELHTFVMDRREHVRNVVGPALAAGSVVILDRYFYSTIAYQGEAGGSVETITADMLREFPVPDVVFLIDVPPAVGLSRVKRVAGKCRTVPFEPRIAQAGRLATVPRLGASSARSPANTRTSY